MKCFTCWEEYNLWDSHPCYSLWQERFTFSTLPRFQDMEKCEKCGIKPLKVDFTKVFSLKNILLYYKWHYKQRIFWTCSARSTTSLENLRRNKKPIKNRIYSWLAKEIREKWDIHDRPYPLVR